MRRWIDLEGNKAEIVLFSELENEKNPSPEEHITGKNGGFCQRDDAFPFYSPNEVKEVIKEVKEVKETQLKRKSAIREVLDQLTPKQKEVIEMKFWGRMSNKEMAEKIGIDTRAIRYRLEGAIKKLKKYLT